jgi:hypothetical protein
VQEIGLPPLDLFADIRVLMARTTSYPIFALGVVASVVARSAVLAGLAGDGSRASFLDAMQFYGTALIPGLLGAGFEFSGVAALYHWYFWIGLGIAVVATLVMGWGPWTQGVRSGDPRPSRLGSVATVAWYLVALAILGALAHAGGRVASVSLVLPSAWLTWTTERRLREGPAGVGRRALAAGAAVALLVILALAVVRLPSDGTAPTPRHGSLFIVAGVDSATGLGPMFRLDPAALGYDCHQTSYFSYAGPGKGVRQTNAACPVTTGKRYTTRDTQRPLASLVSSLRAQLAPLRRPVTVLTHSQAAWIAWAALAGRERLGVRDLIMLGPFPRAPVQYPPSGRTGPGRVGGDFLRALSGIGRKLSISTFDPDAPLARELLGTPGAIARILSRPLARAVHAVAIEPVLDLSLMPQGRDLPRALNACPVRSTHVGVVSSRAAAGVINRVLDGRTLPACPLGAGWLSALTAPFGVPPSGT